MRKKTRKLLWDALFLRSWWVYVFCFLCFLFYNHFTSNRREEINHLQLKLKKLEDKRDIALIDKEDLHIQICSQSDPSWIELVLMKQLGVVPEGYMKIHFKKE